MCWRGTIIEQVPKMRSAAGTFYFITCHPMTGIGSFRYFVRGQRCIETGPAGSRFKLRIGTEQLTSARGTEINSFFVIVPILILVWRLGFGFAENLKLTESQDLSPLVITQRHLFRHRSRLDLAPDSRGVCVFRLADVNSQDAQQE